MIAVKQPAAAYEPWWRTLLRLLALPLLLCSVLVGAWLSGGSDASIRVANAKIAFAIAGPLLSVAVALIVLKNGSERPLAVATPLMLWVYFSTERGATEPWYALLVAHVAVLVLLFGSRQHKRKLAQVAAVCGGAAIIWVQLTAALLHG